MFSWIVCPNRREYRRRCETARKFGKQIERCVIASRLPRALDSMATFVKGGPAADWGKRLAIPVVTQLSSRIRPVVHRPGAGPPSRIKHVDPRTGRNRLFYATRQRIQVSAAFASLSQQAWCAPAASVMGMHENNPIQPVNAFSNAVDPRKLYPHFDHLMRNLYHSGQQHGTDLVWHRNVLVCAGQLVRIVP